MRLFKNFLSAMLSIGIILSFAPSVFVFAEGGTVTSETRASEIPTNLEECCQKLDEILSQEVKDKLKASSDNDLGKFHMGLGLWIRNNWIYPCENGKIAELLYDNGCSSADEMSGIILRNYRHYLITGESAESVKDLVINYWFDFWRRFFPEMKREEMQRKIEKAIQYNLAHKNESTLDALFRWIVGCFK